MPFTYAYISTKDGPNQKLHEAYQVIREELQSVGNVTEVKLCDEHNNVQHVIIPAETYRRLIGTSDEYHALLDMLEDVLGQLRSWPRKYNNKE